MHGCGDSLGGCLSVRAWRIGGGLHTSAYVVREETNKEGLRTRAWRVGKGLNVTARLVCTANRDAYLNVSPNVLWLSPDMFDSAEFEIISNVVWKVE